MDSKRQLDFEEFLADHPVFALPRLAAARGDGDDLVPARHQLKYHVRTGRIRRVAHKVYAAVPPGIEPESFEPDPFQVAAAIRPEGIFAYHSALELLGQAHSAWNRVTLHCDRRRKPLSVGRFEIFSLGTPKAIEDADAETLGTREVARGEIRVVTTGPERTLVEGLRHPHHCGGLDEHTESVSGFPVLDLGLLVQVLEVYDERSLWAATGWLVERERDQWRPPEEFLDLCRRNRPRGRQYLLRGSRGGTSLPDWNLIVPSHLLGGFEGHAPDA